MRYSFKGLQPPWQNYPLEGVRPIMSVIDVNTPSTEDMESLQRSQGATIKSKSTLVLLMKQRPLLLLGWALFFFGIPLASTIIGTLLLLLDLVIVLVRIYLLHQSVPGPTVSINIHHSKTRYTLVMFLLLVVWASAGGIVSKRPDIALPATFGLALVMVIFLFRAGDILWNDGWLLKRTMPFLVLGLLTAALYGIYASQVKGIARLRLIGHGPNGSGTALLISILLAWSYADLLANPWLKAGTRLTALAAIPSLLFTYSRGAWLGFAGGATSLVLSKRSNIIWILIGLLIIASVVALNPRLEQRARNIFSIKRNMDRVELWSVTTKLIPDHLLFGVGTAVFPHVYQDYSPRGNAMAFAHNFFLQALAEYGIPGFVLILAMVGMIIWTGCLLVRTKKWPLASGVLAAVIGTLIHQQVDNTIHGANLAGAFWFLCGFLLALDAALPNLNPDIRKPE